MKAAANPVGQAKTTRIENVSLEAVRSLVDLPKADRKTIFDTSHSPSVLARESISFACSHGLLVG